MLTDFELRDLHFNCGTRRLPLYSVPRVFFSKAKQSLWNVWFAKLSLSFIFFQIWAHLFLRHGFWAILNDSLSLTPSLKTSQMHSKSILSWRWGMCARLFMRCCSCLDLAGSPQGPCTLGVPRGLHAGHPGLSHVVLSNHHSSMLEIIV